MISSKGAMVNWRKGDKLRHKPTGDIVEFDDVQRGHPGIVWVKSDGNGSYTTFLQLKIADLERVVMAAKFKAGDRVRSTVDDVYRGVFKNTEYVIDDVIDPSQWAVGSSLPARYWVFDAKGKQGVKFIADESELEYWSEPPAKPGAKPRCNKWAHKWKKYVGFTDKFEYCEHCDVKKHEIETD